MGSFDDLYFYEKKAPEKQAQPDSSKNPPINYNDVIDFSPGKSNKPGGKDPASDLTITRPGAGNDSSQTTANRAKGTVYIDIGHCTSGEPGKRDPGFETANYNECQINTAVGKKLANELQKDGFRVVPTWNPNNPPEAVPKKDDLQRRNDVVNRDVAAKCDDSIYVSVHHDMDGSKQGGQCVFIAEPKYNESLPLAQSIQNSAWKVRERKNVPNCINSDTATQNGKLVGLRGVNSVGVLVESANAANPDDRARMSTPAHQDAEAKGIARGIANYFKLRQGSERPFPTCKRSPG
jgi:N-acetylmuramoyl-L-alanine amidase